MPIEPRALLSYEEALCLVLGHAPGLGDEIVGLENLSGRVLSADVQARCDLPAFDNSAVDGYGVHADDTARVADGKGALLSVVGSFRAGDDPGSFEVAPGQTVRVFTGSALPRGVGAVVMQEDAERLGSDVRLSASVELGDGIRRRGEESLAGAVVLARGHLASPGSTAAAAAAGIHVFHVRARPRIGILATGDELASPGSEPSVGKVFEANSFGLAAAARSLGLCIAEVRRSRDDADSVRSVLKELLEECDTVLTSGGVSVGEHDLVRGALRELGVREVFWGVAVKPGKPLYFGVLEGDAPAKTVFGLPGNPLSTMAMFQVFVVPHLLARMGAPDPAGSLRHARLGRAIEHRTGRLEFVPCRLDPSPTGVVAHPTELRGSHMLGGIAGADGLLLFPADLPRLEQDASAATLPIRWSLP